MGFGAANEVIEFLATTSLRETNVGGYENTGWDLVAHFVGSVLAAVVIYGWQWRATDSRGHCERWSRGPPLSLAD